MPDKPRINQNIMDVIKNSGFSLEEFTEGCRRLKEMEPFEGRDYTVGNETITLREGRVYRKTEGEPIRLDGPVELPVKRGFREIPFDEWTNGPIIGRAVLVPSGPNGIFIMKVEIYGQDVVGTGVVHFPIREGDVIDTMYVKRDDVVQS